jgi:hypothetical protein
METGSEEYEQRVYYFIKKLVLTYCILLKTMVFIYLYGR